jgi:hypothetical protein
MRYKITDGGISTVPWAVIKGAAGYLDNQLSPLAGDTFGPCLRVIEHFGFQIVLTFRSRTGHDITAEPVLDGREWLVMAPGFPELPRIQVYYDRENARWDWRI